MTENGWIRVRLGDVAHQVSDHEHDPAAAGLKRFVGLEHLDPEHIMVERWGSIADGTTFTKRFQAGQLLFAKRRAYQRKAAVADFDGLCSGDLIVIEANSGTLLPELLPHIVHIDRFLDHALRTSSGSLSPRTKWKDLAEYEFEIPSLNRQREIAATLEGAQRQVADARLAEDSVRRLVKSLLVGLHAQAEETMALGDVAEVRLGRQRSPDKTRGVAPTPYLRAANVSVDRIGFSDVLEMDFSDRERRVFELLPGDVLLVEGNAQKTGVGVPAIYTESMPSGVCFQNTLVRLRSVDTGLLRPAYLYAACRALYWSGIFASIANGTNIKHLGAKNVVAVRIPIPPPSTQDQLLDRIGAADAVVGHLGNHVQASVRQFAQLRQRLLEEAW